VHISHTKIVLVMDSCESDVWIIFFVFLGEMLEIPLKIIKYFKIRLPDIPNIRKRFALKFPSQFT
jgi:hypothetical protein